MILASIVAHDPNLVIGKDGTLPWHYSEDLKFFKRTTMGHPIVMGRGVFEELNEKPLPGRRNVVLSRTRTYDHVETFSSWEDARDALSNEEKVFIIGGGEIYRQTLHEIDLLYVTLIHQEYSGDTYFPEYRDDISTIWKEVEREEHNKLSFITYKRK
jgi:dihydrofolate reductase